MHDDPAPGAARVVTFGEALATIDVTDPAAVDLHVAGAELNTAVGLARLGTPVTWASRVADDALGALVTATLRREGIDDSAVTIAPGEKTGLIVKSRLDDHTMRSEHYRSDSAASRWRSAGEPSALLADTAWLHATGITPALGEAPRALFTELIESAAARGVRVSLDVNHRPQLVDDDGIRGIVAAVIHRVDTLFCNEEEARTLTGETDPARAARSLAARGPRAVVVKRGRDGALALVEGRIDVTGPFPVAPPTFPVGAGDAFAAAWIHAELAALPVPQTLVAAAWAASRVVAHPTDHEGFPRAGAYRELLASLRSGAVTAPHPPPD